MANISIVVSVLAIILAVIGFRDYLFPKRWRKKYIQEHTPTPYFEIEMNSRLGGSGIYVQPKIEMKDKDKKKVVKLLRDYFFDEVFVEGTKNGERVFCILGDTGVGKTAALVNLFVDYIQHYTKRNLPYHIWLYSLADQNVFEKISDIKDKGKSILLLDAVDENDEAKDDNTYNEFIRKLEKAYQDFAFVVTTCRPQFFGDESEVFDTTKARRNGFFLKCKQLHLAPIDDGQVREYLYNLYFHDPNKQLKQKEAERIVRKCPNIVQRPLVLSYIDHLVNDKEKDYETTLDIYDAIVTSLIRREVEKSSPDANIDMMQQWRDLLSEVASFMYKNKKLIISRNEYDGILSEHNLKMPEDKKIFRQRSLLTRTVDGFQFSHKSFYEYFMAYRFFFNYGEVGSLQNVDFMLQIYDELYLVYDSGKGNEHFGIDAVPINAVANSLFSIGKGLQEINRFSKAEEKYEEALEKYRALALSSPEAYQPYVAMTLNNLGALHSDIGKHKEAEKEYGEALKIRSALALSSPEAYQTYVAMTLNNMAALHADIGKHTEAEHEYAEALETYRRLSKASPEAYLPNVAIMLNNLGNLHQNTGKHAEAEEEYREALEIRRQLAASSPEAYLPNVATTMNNLGILHKKIGKHKEAEMEYVEALEIFRQLANSCPETYLPDVAETLNNLGNLHSNTGKHAEAEKEYAEALEICRQLDTASPQTYLPNVATTLNNLGNLHYYLGNYYIAEKEYGEALEKRHQLAASSPEAYLPDLAMTLFNIAILRINQGELDDAEKLAQESLEKYKIMAESSPAAFNRYVKKTKELLEWIQSQQEPEDMVKTSECLPNN